MSAELRGQHDSRRAAGHEHQPHYRHLLVMILLSFASMYVLMYAMVNVFANAYLNVNQLYMAALMTGPMVIIELVAMRAMYRDRRLNVIAIAASLLVVVTCWTMIRQQTGITDQQFLRSMIPHHASAILMCQQAHIQDTEIIELCKAITLNQQAEINQMRATLNRLGR